ncbi:MAG: HD domain-containing protein [Fibrobacterota bacterium]
MATEEVTTRKAIIDAGTRGIRLIIAECPRAGRIRELDHLEQFIPIGSDTFSDRRKISEKNIAKVIRAIQDFKRIAGEYAISEKEIIAIASSSIKEASNRDNFIDKIAIATGMEMGILSDRELAKYIYISYKRLADKKNMSDFFSGNSLIYHVGGGNSPLIFMKDRIIQNTHISHFGTLRAIERIGGTLTDTADMNQALYKEIERRIDNTFYYSVSEEKIDTLITYGRSIRQAGIIIDPGNADQDIFALDPAQLSHLARTLSRLSADEVAREYNLPYSTAKFLVPAVWTYYKIAEKLQLNNIYIMEISMYDGLLLDQQGIAMDLQEQSLKAALFLGSKYHFDQAHALRVASTAEKLFDLLAPHFRLGDSERHLLTISAYLHDIGKFISGTDHHKHSQYLIRSSNLFGVSRRELIIISYIVRYHRKKYPTELSRNKRKLSYGDRILVMKLAAILRIADSLDKGKLTDRDISFRTDRGKLIIETPYSGSMNLEKIAIRENNRKFRDIYGLTLHLSQNRDRSTANGKRPIQ